MGRKVIIELQVLPPISVMSLLMKHDTIILEGYETYQKRSYRNRLHIVDAQGKQVVSIPLVKGKHEQQSIRDVQISYDTAWDVSFIRLIKAAYGSAPYFEYYYDDIVSIIKKKHTLLWDLNRQLNTPATYDQVFLDRHGFIADVSILDMLMCCGPETPLHLMNQEV